MKNKQIFVLGVLISIMLITIASGSMSSLGTFNQNECIELIQTCASCSYVNFTRVSYPDGTTALENIQADKDGNIFNSTFCRTDQLGKYIVYGVGDVDETDTVFAYDFEIKPTGIFAIDFNETGELIILIILFLIAGVLFFIKQYMFASIMIIINGFFMLISNINVIASSVIIAIGVYLAFYDGGSS